MEDEDYDGVASIDYKGEHSAPMSEDGAPLWNVADKGIYPDDVYGPNGMSWYGTGDRFLDSEAYSILRKAYGRRDKQLTIYLFHKNMHQHHLFQSTLLVRQLLLI